METAPRISLRSYGGETRRHRHAFHQFVLPLHGRLELDTHAGPRCVDPQTLVLIPAGNDHAFRARGDNRFAVVDVGDDHPLCERALAEPAFPLSPMLRQQLALLQARAAKGAFTASFRHHWTALLFDLLETDEEAPPDAGARLHAAAVARVRADAAIGVRELAAAVGVGRARLHELFRRYGGTTPGAFITHTRLQHGARMLLASRRDLSTIALDCGFSEHSAFTRAFRRAYGITPSAYRRRGRSSA